MRSRCTNITNVVNYTEKVSARMHRRAFCKIYYRMLPIRYAGRHTNFWQQNIERKQRTRSSASSPKVCCTHTNEVAAFINGATHRTEALFQNVFGQITLSKEGGFGDAGRRLVQIASARMLPRSCSFLRQSRTQLYLIMAAVSLFFLLWLTQTSRSTRLPLPGRAHHLSMLSRHGIVAGCQLA